MDDFEKIVKNVDLELDPNGLRYFIDAQGERFINMSDFIKYMQDGLKETVDEMHKVEVGSEEYIMLTMTAAAMNGAIGAMESLDNDIKSL